MTLFSQDTGAHQHGTAKTVNLADETRAMLTKLRGEVQLFLAANSGTTRNAFMGHAEHLTQVADRNILALNGIGDALRSGGGLVINGDHSGGQRITSGIAL